MKKLLFGGPLLALLLAGCYSQVDTSWSDLLTAQHRSFDHMQRDQYRHPRETLSYFGVKPCQTVVEIWPGGKGWYTEILAPLLRDCGTLYAAHFSPQSGVPYYRQSHADFTAKLAAYPDVYDKVTVTVLEPPLMDIAPAESTDRVLTFRNVHNWLKAGTADDVFAAFYRALKPGGVLGVVEHRARPGTTLEDMISSGYVTEAAVIELATRAGFTLLGSSEINANPLDDTHHPKGVWTLPPSLRLGEEGRMEYLAIGESDRMTLKFGKPDNG